MAFAPVVFKKGDIDKWFDERVEVTASVYRELKKKHGKYSFGDITEEALHGDKKAIRHLHAALRKDYKSPWREILTSVVAAALEAEPPKHIKWSFDPPDKRRSSKHINISYSEDDKTFTVELRGSFPSPFDPPE